MLKFLFGAASDREERIVWIRFGLFVAGITVVGVAVLYNNHFFANLAFGGLLCIYVITTIWQWSVRMDDIADEEKKEKNGESV